MLEWVSTTFQSLTIAMARRRKADAESVSLFPFLSILACVIGVLTLLIMGLALGQMDQGVIERARDYQQLKLETDAQQEEVVRLEDLLKNVAVIREQLAAAAAELKRLEAQQDQMEKRDDANVQLLAQLNRARKRIADMQAEKKELEQLLAKLRAEVKRLNEPPGEAEVVIQPGGSGTKLQPHFVECRPEGLMLHHSEQPHRVRAADIRSDAEFLKLLDTVAKRSKTDRIVFLIRVDGISTYNAARTVANERLAPNGKLAVSGQGKIDLSLFQKK